MSAVLTGKGVTEVVVGGRVVPYLVGKLSKPVRLQQQRGSGGGDKTMYEKCGCGYEWKKEGKKEKCQNGKLKTTKKSSWKVQATLVQNCWFCRVCAKIMWDVRVCVTADKLHVRSYISVNAMKILKRNRKIFTQRNQIQTVWTKKQLVKQRLDKLGKTARSLFTLDWTLRREKRINPVTTWKSTEE